MAADTDADPVLVRAAAGRIRSGVAIPGELVVREETLQFTFDDGSEDVLTLPVSGLTKIRLHPDEGLLILTLGETRHLFVGAVLGELTESIQGLMDGPSWRDGAGEAGAGPDTDPSDDDESALRLGADATSADDHTAMLRSGPVGHKGTVSLDATQLRYAPTGVLDAMVGVRPVTVDWSEVRRISILKGNDGLLEVAHLGGSIILQTETPAALHAAILARLHASQAVIADDVSAREEAITALTLGWSAAQADGDGFDPLAFLAQHCTEDGDAWPGALVLRRDTLHFLPLRADRTGSGGALTLDVSTVVRLGGPSRGGLPTLRLSSGDRRYAFILASGVSGIQRFWDRCRAPSRVLPWDTMGPHTRARLSGSARFVRLTPADGPSIEIAPARALPREDTWAVVVPGPTATALSVGTRLLVEVGQSEGVYAFDAEVVQVEAPSVDDVHERATLELRPARDLRVYNQRQGFRVGVEFGASARARSEGGQLPPHERVAMAVQDLSIGGCRVRAEASLPVGALLDVTLHLPDGTLRTRAWVLREEPIDAFPGQPYGIRFERLRAVDEDRIHRLVLARQRANLTMPSDDEPSLATNVFR
jgi:hypothetical protein